MIHLKGPILVTGARGFIGTHLLTRLTQTDTPILALDLMPCPKAFRQSPLLEWIQGDIQDEKLVQGLVSRSALIFHLAAKVGDWGEEATHNEVTVGGTQRILKAMEACPKPPRLVLASSIVVYGTGLSSGPCPEDTPWGRALGPYSRAKQKQERLVRRHLSKGLDVRVVRPGNVYGVGCKPWVEDVCRELKRGTPALISGGRFRSGLVHVENVVEILLLTAGRSQAQGQVYNAVDEEGVTWERYFTELAEAAGAPRPRSLPKRLAKGLAGVGEWVYRSLGIQQRPPLTYEALNLLGSDHQLDSKKAAAELAYRPVRSFEEGMRELKALLQAPLAS